MLTVLNDSAAGRSDSIRFGPSADGVERAKAYICTRAIEKGGNVIDNLGGQPLDP